MLAGPVRAVRAISGNRDAGNKHLVIGLDFGAAFSKVVIGDNRVRYAVPFAGFADPDTACLLPSILDVDKNGICHFSSADHCDSRTTSLKLPLLDGTLSNDDKVMMTAYFVLIFRTATGWLLERYKKRYAHCSIVWSVNAGLPAGSDDNDALSDFYQSLIHRAWLISVLPGPVSFNRVKQYMQAEEGTFSTLPIQYRSRFISKSRIRCFPAIDAQVAGYVQSTTANDDLQLLLDIGAATFSIAAFSISGKRCAVYDSAVQHIGVCYLLKRRYENLKLSDADINLFKHIPDAQAFSETYALTEKDIKFADTLYSGEISRQISKLMDHMKTRYCSDTDCWEKGILTTTSGGGARLEIIDNIIRSFENKPCPHRIHSQRPGLPDDLMVENLPQDAFDRLAVAYGLSYAADVIDAVFDRQVINNSESTVDV